MKNLLRWIIVVILLILIIFLFINLFNRSKQNANTKTNNNTESPVVVEKKDDDKVIIPEVKEQPVIEEQIVEVGDTANFGDISIYVGIFTIAAGVYYLRFRKSNI